MIVILCVDGEIQENVLRYCSNQYNESNPDLFTEYAPERWLAEDPLAPPVLLLRQHIQQHMTHHPSTTLLLVSHEHCTQNDAPFAAQARQVRAALAEIARWGLSFARYVGICIAADGTVQLVADTPSPA